MPSFSNGYYIGLISGTSVDGIDAALVHLENGSIELVASHLHPFEQSDREQILALFEPDASELDRAGALDVRLGQLFAAAAASLLEVANLAPSQITALGSHGQTIRHRPDGPLGFSYQIGSPFQIAETLGIPVVSDFRQRDLAVGGQGAPLAPLFHQAFLSSASEDRVILNLGGIANISYLPAQSGSAIAFDTGPANGLMDSWIQQHRQQPFDRDGEWALTGAVQSTLVDLWLSDPYFALPAPKSTGKEYFNLQWLAETTDVTAYSAADIQASLMALTIESVANAIELTASSATPSNPTSVVTCGGGLKNQGLMNGLEQRLGANYRVISSGDLGLEADWVEAMTFAWLAERFVSGNKVSTGPFTGASKPVMLGSLTPA